MRNGSRSSLMYQELTAAHQLVAHYRVWMHLSDGTPQRLQNGWEKYSPDGVLLDREVRYSNPTISDIEPAPISPTLH